MQFSTLIVVIEEITPEKIYYTSKTDVTDREYRHIIPHSSKFPFDELQLGASYALISAKPDSTWYWMCAWNLSESQTLMDETFKEKLL